MSENNKHYVYGSGMAGCLYDYGPHFCLDKEEAVESFIFLFEDSLSPEELIEMRVNLRENGYHSFKNPAEAGAHYCQVSEQNGEIPEGEDD